MITVKYNVSGVLKKVQRMISLSGNLQPVLLKIRGDALNTDTMTIIGGIGAQFISRGSFYGTPWKELSPKYASDKAVRYPGKTTLRASDRLFQSVNIPGSDGNLQILTPTKISWGTDDGVLPYAKWHMTGTRKMSQRKYLGITEEQRNSWTKLISAFIREVEVDQ